jgi:hypothetical protein
MKPFIYLISFVFLGLSSVAQTSKADPIDGEGWYSVTLNADLPKKWEASLDYELRTQNNLQKYYGSYLSLGVNREINKRLSLGAEYRMAFFDYGITYRYTLGAESNNKLSKKINFVGRVLLQNRIQDEYDPAVLSESSLFWRVRGQLRWEATKKMDVYGSVEPVMQVGGNNFVDNWRNIIGVKYKLNKKTKVDFWYMYRPDYGKKSYNRLFHIIGVNLSYRLKV